jgi:hypothetical protein
MSRLPPPPETRLDREFEVVMRIVGGRIGRERPRWAMLEALVDRQDHQLARARQPSMIQQPG